MIEPTMLAVAASRIAAVDNDDADATTIVTIANGTDTAVDTAPATNPASRRIPSTRQNPLRTSASERENAANTGLRSSTTATGANDTMVKSQTSSASEPSPSGTPIAAAA